MILPTSKRYPRLPKTPTKKEIPSETEGSGVSCRGMLVRSWKNVIFVVESALNEWNMDGWMADDPADPFGMVHSQGRTAKLSGE